MDLDIRIDGESMTMIINGAIDTEGGSELTAKFMELIKDPVLKKAEINLEGVPSITSAGIGKLLTFFKQLDQRGGGLAIKGISPQLKKQFTEIHLDQILSIS